MSKQRRCEQCRRPNRTRYLLCDTCRLPCCDGCGRTFWDRRKVPPNGLCRACLGGEPGVILPSRPPEPTAVPPGTDKVAVMAARHAAGQSLWHADDARHDA
jgi:hypothetical protein